MVNGTTFSDMIRIILVMTALLVSIQPTRAAGSDFTPWVDCAARLMGFDGKPWRNIAYYPYAHPDHLGAAMIDGPGAASVWASPAKPWVQLHEACHVIQFSRGEVAPSGHDTRQDECRAVQEHWRRC
jgi:hypothetical protein